MWLEVVPSVRYVRDERQNYERHDEEDGQADVFDGLHRFCSRLESTHPVTVRPASTPTKTAPAAIAMAVRPTRRIIRTPAAS